MEAHGPQGITALAPASRHASKQVGNLGGLNDTGRTFPMDHTSASAERPGPGTAALLILWPPGGRTQAQERGISATIPAQSERQQRKRNSVHAVLGDRGAAPISWTMPNPDPLVRTIAATSTAEPQVTRSDQDLYLTLAGGLLWPQQLSGQNPEATYAYRDTLNQSFSVEAGFGYRLGSLRTELTYTNEQQDLATYRDNLDFTDTFSQGTVRTQSLLLSLYYDFRTKSSWTPYVGAGLGYAWQSVSPQRLTLVDINLPPYAGHAFAWQAKAGISHSFSRTMNLFGEIIYKGTAGYDYHSCCDYSSNMFSRFGLQLGTRLAF